MKVMKSGLVLAAVAILTTGIVSTAFANTTNGDKAKATVKCKGTDGKVTMVETEAECTKAKGTVEK